MFPHSGEPRTPPSEASQRGEAEPVVRVPWAEPVVVKRAATAAEKGATGPPLESLEAPVRSFLRCWTLELKARCLEDRLPSFKCL